MITEQVELTVEQKLRAETLLIFSHQNLRDGIGKIFTGSAAANAQRDHCLAIGRKAANKVEKALATGTGTTASPAIMGFEGSLQYTELIGL